jgi:DNA-binding protein H-NS
MNPTTTETTTIEAPSNLYNPDTGIDDDREMTYLTLDEMAKMLTAEEARLARAEAEFEQARQAYDRNVLSVENDVIRAELDAEHLPAMVEAEGRAAGKAGTIRANLRDVYDQTQRSQYLLTDAEHAAVAARAPMIRDDCGSEPLPRLVDAIRYAILKDDRPALYCYAKFAPRRLAEGTRDDSGQWKDTTSNRERAEIRRMLKAIDARLKDPSLAPINQRAGELLVRAGKLEGAATQRAMRQRTYGFQSPGEVAW